MLKTYRIIPLVFILFLFGFTLITVAPVIAEDSPEFIACQEIDPMGIPRGGGGRIRLMKQKIICLSDVARVFQDQLNAKIPEPEAKNARLLAMQTAPTDPSGGEVGQLNARIDELKGDLKWTYEDGIIQRCKVNLLKERLVKWKDTNPFHGQDNALLGCFKENVGISDVGNGKEYSYYFGRK
jgi:hypothetical protein